MFCNITSGLCGGLRISRDHHDLVPPIQAKIPAQSSTFFTSKLFPTLCGGLGYIYKWTRQKRILSIGRANASTITTIVDITSTKPASQPKISQGHGTKQGYKRQQIRMTTQVSWNTGSG
ncbi:hypothetical protein FHG87_009387 [Trinorchestia longiramus]|nr:hypothetical protein FHG87_009387 [Trinorchestia longiramus]